MAGLLHFFDFNQGNASKKQKNHAELAGFEAPRNSLELPPSGSLQSYYSAEELELYSCEGRQTISKSNSCSTEASVKRLLNEEVSKELHHHKHNMPSIVARLMGMDVLPAPAESFVEDLQSKDESTVFNDGKREVKQGVRFTGRSRKKSKSSKEKKFRFSYKDAYGHLWSSGSKTAKPSPRVHPQEKELQQFKKDFEAWQAARFLECARLIELGNIPEQWLAQLDLTKEKMAVYETARKAALDKANVLNSDVLKSRSSNEKGWQQCETKMEEAFSEKQQKEPNKFRKKIMDSDSDQLSMADIDQNSERFSSLSRIVILKPAPDSAASNDESWVSSASSLEDRDNIEDLLEEVKKRLKCELEGTTLRKGSMVRGGGIETPFKEKPLVHPRHSPQHLTMQVNEKFAENHNRRLFRSESMGSYRGENQALEPSSPDLISRATRKLLSERLRNVLNVEDENHNVSNSSSSPSFSDDTRARLEQARNILNARCAWNDWNGSPLYEAAADARSSSFRDKFQDKERSKQELVSPRKLVRSLSAPISGTPFRKLLLEDRHVHSGAQIRRKHESPESGGETEFTVRKKERFTFRERVSNIRHNLNLRKKLFSKKFQSAELLSPRSQFDRASDFMGGPTVVMNFDDKIDNYTEVPPSPASVCSSNAHEELWKPDHPSPLSDMTSLGDQSVGNVFREISSNLSELRRQLNQLDYDGSEVTSVTEEQCEADLVNLDNEVEAYVRDLLVASGLYDGSLDKSFPRWDPFVKHINDSVFEKVEESYRKTNDQSEEEPSKDDYEDRLQRKVLYDLSNEALGRILGPPMTMSKFRRKIIGDTMVPPPMGRKLLEKVWDIICVYLYPSSLDDPFDSLEGIVAHDLEVIPWFNLIDEEVRFFGRELEARITGDLIEEVVKDIIRVTIAS